MSRAPIIPYLTLDRIRSSIENDQGARFRELSGRTLPQCADAYNPTEEGPRTHLGASVIGQDCARKVWYGFRWCTLVRHDARLLRLFNRGHLEEGRFVAVLLLIGCEVWQHDEQGKQFRISDHNGHAGGSLDCVLRGIPEWPTTALLGEFKTHGDKSFSKLAGDDWVKHLADPKAVPFSGVGVREAKFEHFVQMQLYMGHNGLGWALYLAVNKNDDSIYAELVQFDPAIFEAFRARMRDVIHSTVPLARIKNDSSWWQCKTCDSRHVCWDKATPQRTCRSCEHSKLGLGGKWICTHDVPIGGVIPPGRELDKGAQLRACEHYSLLPSLRQ